MSLSTTPTGVVIRRGRKSTTLELSAMSLRGTETTIAEVEQRLSNALSAEMAPDVVAVHVESLDPLEYVVFSGPQQPPANWWTPTTWHPVFTEIR